MPTRTAPSVSTVPTRTSTATRRRLMLLAAAVLLVAAVVISVGAGAMRIAPTALLGIFLAKLGMSTTLGFEPQQEAVLWAIRLPRACLGVLVGASLGLAGAAMQGLFRNPLADPGLIGVSAGASLAAVATIVLQATLFQTAGEWLGLYLLPVAAFVGACGTTLVVYQLSKEGGRAVVSTMLLAGIAINALAGALTGLLTYVATDAQLRSITFWGLGSLGGASWPIILSILPFLVVPLLWLPRLGKQLNLLALGEGPAAHLGLPVASLKRQLIVLSTLAVGTSVAVAGAIGFLGLVVPHLVRLVAGPDHRGVLLGSALGGAAVLTLADTLARTVAAPTELPIGILTALLGTPAFIVILLREKRRLF
ncbi:FecCD family ABC transporter permease [Hymenobacter profundi]|uniref:Iron ABC transporter permease n=1 Tax=Hymenobacter profundi TaxID=1982110 RepID=A0ABS6WY30_9BACT|nr:iron ABC transporter permease [Hymenobacter profundi]MBW3128499.1 iron ABC transporter permease [Hymenobacter profundi]MBW3128538.1 iron ABC transporter permease [Hymenobacter profundi]